MQTRKLGRNLEVSAIGLGCMGMTWAYGATERDRGEAIATIHRALDLGVTLLDTDHPLRQDAHRHILERCRRQHIARARTRRRQGVDDDRANAFDRMIARRLGLMP